MTDPITFTVFGIPRTKKTSNRIVWVRGKPKVLPSLAWEKWVETCVIVPSTPVPYREYNVTALFYRDALRGDSHGYYQGLADLLEKHHIIANDVTLVSWDGSRMLKDKDNPRVEVTLTEVTE